MPRKPVNPKTYPSGLKNKAASQSVLSSRPRSHAPAFSGLMGVHKRLGPRGTADGCVLGRAISKSDDDPRTIGCQIMLP